MKLLVYIFLVSSTNFFGQMPDPSVENIKVSLKGYTGYYIPKRMNESPDSITYFDDLRREASVEFDVLNIEANDILYVALGSIQLDTIISVDSMIVDTVVLGEESYFALNEINNDILIRKGILYANHVSLTQKIRVKDSGILRKLRITIRKSSQIEFIFYHEI